MSSGGKPLSSPIVFSKWAGVSAGHRMDRSPLALQMACIDTRRLA